VAGELSTDSGVAFVQSEEYVPKCFNCGGSHTVNKYPKLDTAGRNKFWADRKAARKAKHGVIHADVADKVSTPVPAPTPAPAANTSEEFERFQKYLVLVEGMKDLDVEFTQVGKLVEKKCLSHLSMKKLQSVLRLTHTSCTWTVVPRITLHLSVT
jgi:hypothetical protein